MFEDLGGKLANFGNTVKTGATNVFDDAKRGASNLSETISLKRIIDSSKNEIKNAYYIIGERYYKTNKDSIPEGYEAVFSRIGEMEKAIAEAEKELEKLSGARKCPRCGNSVKKEYSFCTNCGFEIGKSKNEMDEVKICPNCHSEMTEGAVFCKFCGTKLEKEKSEEQDEQ